MAEFRGVKRSAERAAREALGTTLIDAAGKLGVALAAEQAHREQVKAAQQRSDELIDAARSEGAALLAAAEAEAVKSASDYRNHWDESKAAGWRPAQLVAMGYPRPSVRMERCPRATSIPESKGASSGEESIDESPTDPASQAVAGSVESAHTSHDV